MLCFGIDLLTVVCADVFCYFLFLFGTSFDGLMSFWFPATRQINIVVAIMKPSLFCSDFYKLSKYSLTTSGYTDARIFFML